MLSITGGVYKGRKINSYPGSLVRPTSGKVREALFSIIGPRLIGSSFLELFAGNGTVGIEALSRGAGDVCMVEENKKVYQLIKSNCKLLNIDIVQVRCESAANFCKSTKESFDIVFADPPFTEPMEDLAGYLLPKVKAEGWAIIQFPSRNEPIWAKAASKIKKYGESSLAIFYT